MTAAGADRSQSWCAAVMKRESKSFFFSTRILPRKKREAVEALYGVCRFADDAADEPGLTAEERFAVLDAVERDIAMLRSAGHASDFPWFPALQCAFACFPISTFEVTRLVRGCRDDVDGVEVRSMDDLERYAGAVAGTVGRCAMAILGASDADSLARGERLGIAMQFTNVLRDVEEDRRMGRNYLPLEEFSGKPAQEVMKVVSARARLYYRESQVLASRVPNDGSRASLVMTGAVYEGILDKLESRGFDPRLGRAHVGTIGKITRALRSCAFVYAGLPTIK